MCSRPRPLLCAICLLFGSSDVNLNQTHIVRQFQKAFSFSTMSLQDHNLSRANSRASGRSGRSGNGSSMSRNQSLIKKNIQLQDLKPADVLIERFVAWKAIVQQLTAYFEVCFVPCRFGLWLMVSRALRISKQTLRKS